MNESAATLFVVDDEPDARRGVAALASSMGIRCETFASGEELLARFNPAAAGCLLIDLRLNGMSGLELIERLSAKGSTLPVILISAYADVRTTVRAMNSGALTVIEKPYQADELADAIQAAVKADRHAREEQARRAEVRRRMSTLTPRERQTMELIMAGKPNKAISRELDFSQRTVDRVRAVVLQKIGVDSAVALARVVTDARVSD
ncbi:MAG TPA: response regulator [Thermoguttaceae bacterium]|nr:response regulator [Thermoguttaceae bacterium]